MVESTKKMINALRLDQVFANSLNIPQILIVTPDTQGVVDMYKELKHLQNVKNPIMVRVQKLFAKHITVEEHEALLNADIKKMKVINIYVGTPNRLKKLVERNAIKLKKPTFKYLVLDSHLNVKS